jgi:hypothetical protein
MKSTLYSIALVLLFGCGKPSETNIIASDSTEVAGEETTSGENSRQGSEKLDRFLSDFEVSSNALPSISFSRSTEVGNYRVTYYFEDDFLSWVEIATSEEGGIAENYLVSRDPEGTFYLHYGTDMDGAFGYVGMDEGDWQMVKTDGNYKPYLNGTGPADKFEYEIEFEDVMNTVRENRAKFTLKNGTYEYALNENDQEKQYQFSEVLFESNLLSPTRFNAEMIKGYLNWWYPLYEDASGTLYRHKLCEGDEDYIKIIVEAGNYRWEEETSGKTIVYAIKGFEESEGDAFFATIERNGNRIQKILIKPENPDDSDNDRLLIDGRVYTSEPSKYDYVTLKCD